MAGYGAFQFASPAQYGDWAQYAGLNRTTGEVEENRLAQAVKPPENIQQLIGQRFAPAQNMMAAVAPAMQQLGQGNLIQAAGTMRSAQKTVQPTQQPQAPVIDTGYDYTHGLD